MIKSTRDVADLPPIENGQPKSVEYIKTDRSSFMFSKLTRNLALSALMLIGIVSVRNAQLPSGETLLTAAQNLQTVLGYQEHTDGPILRPLCPTDTDEGDAET